VNTAGCRGFDSHAELSAISLSSKPTSPHLRSAATVKNSSHKTLDENRLTDGLMYHLDGTGGGTGGGTPGKGHRTRGGISPWMLLLGGCRRILTNKGLWARGGFSHQLRSDTEQLLGWLFLDAQETQVKHSVAELAGMFKGQVLPKPSGVEGCGPAVLWGPACVTLGVMNVTLAAQHSVAHLRELEHQSDDAESESGRGVSAAVGVGVVVSSFSQGCDGLLSVALCLGTVSLQCLYCRFVAVAVAWCWPCVCRSVCVHFVAVAVAVVVRALVTLVVPFQGRPVRRKPPCSLQLQAKKEGLEGDEEKSQIISPHPPKVKAKSSPLIEKLQANLALSPTGPSPGPKSPGMKVPILPFAMTPPGGPLSPGLRLPQRQLSEEEVPASFEKPAEGAVLPSINKGRARHSMKRRPPTRQHRKSCGDEGGAVGGPESPQQNGDEDDVFLEGSKDAVEAQEPTFPAKDSGGVAKDSPGNAEENAEEAQAEMTDAAPGDATSVEPQKDEAPTSAPEEVKEAGEEASGKPQASDIAPEALKALEAQTEPGPGAEEAAPAESQEEEEEEKGEEGEKTQAPEEREGKEEESKEKETEEQPKGTGE
ncbi:hypothetical protein JZ751_013944, partial [Albula glossodonta]